VLDLVTTYNSSSLFAFQSTNDGASWKVLDTTALNTAIKNAGWYIYSDELFNAPGGPIVYAGSDGQQGPIVQLNDALTTATQIGTDVGALEAHQLARAKSGALFITGYSSTPNVVPFQAGAHTGTVTFPSCAIQSDVGNLAAGSSNAVVVETGCGHVWARSISATGVVGSLKTLGRVQISAASTFSPWAQVNGDRSGHYTAVWDREGGDLGVAHSSSGSTWKAATRSVPTAGVVQPYGIGRTVSSGAATWYAESAEVRNASTGVYSNILRAVSLSDTYKAPKYPSHTGIAHAKHGRLGSLAVTVSGKVKTKTFRKTGKLKVRIVGAMSDKVTVEITDTKTSGQTVTYNCSGEVTKAIKAGHARTISATCQGSSISVGGGGASYVLDVHKGDDLTYQFTGRNGVLAVKAKLA
jgi:hypothetical protein